MLEMNVGTVHPLHRPLSGWDDGPGGVGPIGRRPYLQDRRPVTRVLVVTACAEAHAALRRSLEAVELEVLHAEDPGELGRMVGPAKIDLVLCDQRLCTDDGLELLQAIRGNQSTLPIAWFDALPARHDRLPALPHGPIGRLTLPLKAGELQRLLKAAEEPALPQQTAVSPGSHLEFHGMFASTPGMHQVFNRIRRVAATDASVLITGESGTGKELVARALHNDSPRRDQPFVALNCSALPSELVESELFGHTRGAFTGALRDRAGLFEAAHGGTLFLDEIGDLGLSAQAKMLRALESHEVMRVGGSKITSVDVRVIAATHRNLPQLVAWGDFREDLLYRLHVVGIELPALRDRPADIPLLAERFVRLFAERHGLPVRLPDAATQALLAAHTWPGNIRELRNCIEGAVILSDGPAITPADLPAGVTVSGGFSMDAADPVTQSEPVVTSGARIVSPLEELPFVEAREVALDEFDRAYLASALSRHGGNIAQTARAIGLHRQSLQKLLTRRHMRTPGLRDN